MPWNLGVAGASPGVQRYDSLEVWCLWTGRSALILGERDLHTFPLILFSLGLSQLDLPTLRSGVPHSVHDSPASFLWKCPHRHAQNTVSPAL
jgi:hypothetical protein